MLARGIMIRQLEIGPMANFTYIIGDPTTMTAAVIDPGWEAGRIIDEADKDGLTITHILLTHTHFDHASAAGKLAKKTGAIICVHRLENGSLEDGETIKIGDLNIKCIHTPGHTPGSVCFLINSAVFTGDTLFVDAIGRTDLEGSNEQDMIESLKKLSRLPDRIIVYPGHNYGSEPASTIGEQKKRNPYLKF